MPSRPVTALDPRSPLVLDTRELGRRPGSMLELHRDVTAPSDWTMDVVRVPAGASVGLDLRLESVVDGVLVSIDLQAPLVAECGRCLDPIEDELELSLAELFLYDPDPDDEVPALNGDLADLEPLLRDAVVLALPFNPLCTDDCLGLCVTCGARLADVETGHHHDRIDSRWAALAPLTEQNSPSSATMDIGSPAEPAETAAQRSEPTIREK